MADTTYDGIFGTGFAFTITPAGGTAFGTAQAEAQESTPAPAQRTIAKYPRISGPKAGREGFAKGSYQVTEFSIKATYNVAQHAAAMTALANAVLGSLVVDYPDGRSDAYDEATVSEVSTESLGMNNIMTDNLKITVSNPPVTTFGGTVTPVDFQMTMTAGAVTLDLSAIPTNPVVDGTGKAVYGLYLLNPATNANSITIAKGASSGYTGFGTSFSTTLAPGESCQLASKTAISGSVKTLDITGTLAQALVCHLKLQ